MIDEHHEYMQYDVWSQHLPYSSLLVTLEKL